MSDVLNSSTASPSMPIPDTIKPSFYVGAKFNVVWHGQKNKKAFYQIPSGRDLTDHCINQFFQSNRIQLIFCEVDHANKPTAVRTCVGENVDDFNGARCEELLDQWFNDLQIDEEDYAHLSDVQFHQLQLGVATALAMQFCTANLKEEANDALMVMACLSGNTAVMGVMLYHDQVDNTVSLNLWELFDIDRLTTH